VARPKQPIAARDDEADEDQGPARCKENAINSSPSAKETGKHKGTNHPTTVHVLVFPLCGTSRYLRWGIGLKAS
jgi:hypothetical protein